MSNSNKAIAEEGGTMRINIASKWYPSINEDNINDGYFGLSLSDDPAGCCVVDGVDATRQEYGVGMAVLADGGVYALRDVITKARKGELGLRLVQEAQ